jgi:hypothetical protein
MSAAETITRVFGCTLISVISGVGVRDYYENLGYSLDTNEDQYMVKRIDNKNNKNDKNHKLRLFGKIYNTDYIQQSIRSSTIVQKYILKNADPSISNISNTHVYDRIQNGEAQGFAIDGDEGNEGDEGDEGNVLNIRNVLNAGNVAKGLYFSLSFLYILYIFCFSSKSLHTK